MKKFIHALILVVFSIACLFLWGILSFAEAVWQAGHALPPLTILCVNCRPLLIALPIVAAIYCLWVWFRKTERVPSWIGFFAATMGSLVVVAFPAMLAAYTPLIAAVNNYLPHK